MKHSPRQVIKQVVSDNSTYYYLNHKKNCSSLAPRRDLSTCKQLPETLDYETKPGNKCLIQTITSTVCLPRDRHCKVNENVKMAADTSTELRVQPPALGFNPFLQMTTLTIRSLFL